MPVPIDAYIGPIAVTVAYLLFYYGTNVHLLAVKARLHRAYEARGERFDRYFGQDREMLAADRIQLNTLEHMPPFLTLLWLNAAFVGGVGTTIAGALYVATRLIYPFVVGKKLGRNVKWRVLPVTFSGYGVLVYLFGALVWAASR